MKPLAANLKACLSGGPALQLSPSPLYRAGGRLCVMGTDPFMSSERETIGSKSKSLSFWWSHRSPLFSFSVPTTLQGTLNRRAGGRLCVIETEHFMSSERETIGSKSKSLYFWWSRSTAFSVPTLQGWWQAVYDGD